MLLVEQYHIQIKEQLNLSSMLEIIRSIADYEDQNTVTLFNELASLKEQGFLTKGQLLKILRWKSPRPIRHYETNSEETIKTVSKIAFAVDDDNLKIHILTALHGVNYPSASAILMFYDKQKFPVLDIRVWQQLHQSGLVHNNARGQGFSLHQWETYLRVIRGLASPLNLTARQVEKRLFDHDKKIRINNLYTHNGKL